MARSLPTDWTCPTCGRRKRATWHHICPGSIFIFTPQLPLCQKCHAKIHDIIKKKMTENGGEPLLIPEYFRIWEEFTGEKIGYLYDKFKNKLRRRTPEEMKRKKKKKKHRTEV